MSGFQIRMASFFFNPIKMECELVMRNLQAWLWIVLFGIFLIPLTGIAETVYVTENYEITMRTGPATDRKIISLIQSGKALDVMEKGKDWSKVRAPNGREGWVLNRYITTKEPCAMVLDRVRQDYDVLSSEFSELKGQFQALRSQKQATDSDLSQSQKDRQQLSSAYAKLKKESAEFLKLKKRHEQVAAELEMERTRSAKLDEENMQMKRSNVIQWVLTGGGIMLVGFFIGLFSSSRRKSRPLY
jgi:SH3 domain protein